MLLNDDGRLTESVRALIGAMGGVPDHLLRKAGVRPHTDNLLRFPWYPAQRGGAFVLGHRIYVQGRQWRGARMHSGEEPMHTLLLLTHEAGHLPQAERFGYGALGRTRFVLWAAWQYLVSALRHGRHAHDKAHLELEADEGRWVLQQLLAANNGIREEVRELVRANDVTGIHALTGRHAAAITALREHYRSAHPQVFTPR